MTVTVRAVGPDELEAFRATMGSAFGFDPTPELLSRFETILERARSRCAFDGNQMVGTSGAFSLEMTVPGGTVACSGTSLVSVRPSHRRRGVLRAMMAAHLVEARDHGDALAALWASESSIYGRFGFGVAAVELDLTIPRGFVDLHRLAPPPDPVRMVSAEDAGHLLPPVYNKVKGEVPGFYARSETWWLQQSLIDPSSWRNGATSYRFAVSERGREITGYVQYRVQQRWKDHHGASTVKVKELITTDPSSAAGLWAFVINQDLAAEIEASHRPLAEPLLDLLDAPRRVHSRLADSLWVKILDVPAALSARRYWVPGSLTFEVRDPMEERPRRYVLEAGEGESTCRPSRSRPDVSLDAEDLGACYLGRSRFQQLGAAGRLEGSREALQRADAMFTWHPQPWCPEVF